MRSRKISAENLPALAARLKGWTVSETDLRKTYKFRDFVEAFGFMTQAALVAQQLDHHPVWTQRFHLVEVSITTWESGGVTDLDILLAGRFDGVAARFSIAGETQ